jgi:hypothetical protein
VRLATGLRYLRDTGTLDTPHPSALRSVTELGCLAHVRLDERHLLRAGALIVVELQTQPSSHLGVVIDGGVRLNVVLPAEPLIRPYLGAYYTTVPGFDTVVRDSYAGFSGALGVEFGYGL